MTYTAFPRSWAVATLGQVCSRPQYGWTTKAQTNCGGVHLLRTTDITSGAIDWTTVPFCSETPDRLEKYRLETDDLVISRAGSIGASIIIRDVPSEAVFASYLIRFKPISPVDPSYVAYFLKSPDYWSAVTEKAAGIALANINARKLESIQIPLAPPREQRRIVEEIEKQFTRLDAGVAALKRVEANLRRYKAAVLKAGVEGRLTERWRAEHPETEPASELLKRILTERRRRWEQSELAKMRAKGMPSTDDRWKKKYKEPIAPDADALPPLPNGWTWGSIDQLSIVVRGASPRPAGDPRYFGGDVPWITVGPITADDEPYLLAVPETLTARGREESRWIDEETLLLTNSGATLGVPKITRIGGCINDGVAALLFVDYPMKLFLYFYLCSRTQALRAINQGAAQPNLNTGIIRSIVVPLPPLAEQRAIVTEVEERLSSLTAAEEAVTTGVRRAFRLRQSILKRAFEGKLVPQDPTDEPASVLLDRIRSERAKTQSGAASQRRRGGPRRRRLKHAVE